MRRRAADREGPRRAGSGDQARLWIVTRGAQPVDAGATLEGALAAPLWGFGRTLAVEAPSLWGGMVDLDPGDPRATRRPCSSPSSAAPTARIRSRIGAASDAWLAS